MIRLIAVCLFAILPSLLVSTCTAQVDQVATVQPDAKHPDTIEGLQQLLRDILQAAKSRDDSRESALIESLLVPDGSAWFKYKFGPAFGPRLEKNYQQVRPTLVEQMRTVFEADAERGWPQLKVLEYSDAATVNSPIDNFLNCMETVTPLYQTEFNGRGVGAQFGPDPNHPGRLRMIAGDLDGFYFYDSGGFRYVPQQTLMLLPKERPLRIQLDWNAMRSKVIHKVDWQYPREAATQHVGGKVVIRLVLDAAGKIKEITPAEGPPILSDTVLQAVKQWTFEPTTLDGDPVEVGFNVEAIFTIN